MKKSHLFILIGAFLFTSNTVLAQRVTFNVNMKPQLEDSIFIPGRDQLKLVGSVAPINTASPYYLTDQEPIDSVYSVTINFSPRYRSQTITYNFEMTVNYRRLTENLQRQLQLRPGEVSLDPLYFNAFAW